jgi:hypothetical protein
MNVVATIDATFENNLNLSADLLTTQELTANLGEIYQGGGESNIYYNTTAYWNSRPQLIAQRGYIYVYSDYKQSEGEDIAGIKVGDGISYLIDMPFIDKPLDDHIADTVKHITSAERESWNNKVRCFVDPENQENIVFTTT